MQGVAQMRRPLFVFFTITNTVMRW